MDFRYRLVDYNKVGCLECTPALKHDAIKSFDLQHWIFLKSSVGQQNYKLIEYPSFFTMDLKNKNHKLEYQKGYKLPFLRTTYPIFSRASEVIITIQNRAFMSSIWWQCVYVPT